MKSLLASKKRVMGGGAVGKVSKLISGLAFLAPNHTDTQATFAKGSPTNTYTRSTKTWVPDFEGILREVQINCPAFPGLRRVENLLTYSEDFSNAAWIKGLGGTGTAATVTSGFTAPDGTDTAWRLQANRGAGTTLSDWSGIAQSLGVGNSRLTIKVKSNTGSNQTVALFRTGAGTVDYRIVTSEWATITTSEFISNITQYFQLGSLGSITSQILDILIWNPQVEKVAGATNQNPSEYLATTSAALTIWKDYANPYTVDGNGVVTDSGLRTSLTLPAWYKGLLNEPAATNSIRNSTMVGAVAGTPGTAPTNWNTSVAAGITRQIIGTGTELGRTYIDVRFSGTVSTSGGLLLDPEANTGISGLVGQTWTHSAYVSLIAGSWPVSRTVYIGITERDSGGVALGMSNTDFRSLVINNIATRVSHTRILSQATTAFAHSVLRSDVLINDVIDFTIRIAQPQMEQGAVATSEMPTSGSTVTRGATTDSFQTTSNLPASGIRHLSIQWIPLAITGTQYLWSSGTATDHTAILHDGINIILRKRVASVNTDAIKALTPVAGTTYQIDGYIYSDNTTAIGVNGTLGTPNANTTAIQTAATMELGSLNGASQAMGNFGPFKILGV